jgi:hypothetical protein
MIRMEDPGFHCLGTSLIVNRGEGKNLIMAREDDNATSQEDQSRFKRAASFHANNRISVLYHNDALLSIVVNTYFLKKSRSSAEEEEEAR